MKIYNISIQTVKDLCSKESDLTQWPISKTGDMYIRTYKTLFPDRTNRLDSQEFNIYILRDTTGAPVAGMTVDDINRILMNDKKQKEQNIQVNENISIKASSSESTLNSDRPIKIDNFEIVMND